MYINRFLNFHDHLSYRSNFCSCEKNAWKKFRFVWDSNPWPLWYRCTLYTNWANKSTGSSSVNWSVINPVKGWWWCYEYMKIILWELRGEELYLKSYLPLLAPPTSTFHLPLPSFQSWPWPLPYMPLVCNCSLSLSKLCLNYWKMVLNSLFDLPGHVFHKNLVLPIQGCALRKIEESPVLWVHLCNPGRPVMICMKKLRFSTWPGAKVRRHMPLGTARARPCEFSVLKKPENLPRRRTLSSRLVCILNPFGRRVIQ